LCELQQEIVPVPELSQEMSIRYLNVSYFLALIIAQAPR
jgi:hypothetical protein